MLQLYYLCAHDLVMFLFQKVRTAVKKYFVRKYIWAQQKLFNDWFYYQRFLTLYQTKYGFYQFYLLIQILDKCCAYICKSWLPRCSYRICWFFRRNLSSLAQIRTYWEICMYQQNCLQFAFFSDEGTLTLIRGWPPGRDYIIYIYMYFWENILQYY